MTRPTHGRSGTLAGRFGGHAWTILSSLRGTRLSEPAWNWGAVVDDDRLGSIRLTGLAERGGGLDADRSPAHPTVVIIHGLAGSAVSGYVRRLAAAVVRRGWSALAVNLRGADGLGEDLYHAGLGSDLEAVLAASSSRGPVFVVGYSLGGHLALRYLAGACPRGGGRDGPTVPVDRRIRAAIAVCPPLDLLGSVKVIDGREASLYRRYLLRRLNRLYAQVAERRGELRRAERARRVRRIQDWDEIVVAPRYGFDGAEDYYRTVSVAPVLPRIRVPTLLVAARHDPMVPASTIEPHLASAPAIEPLWAERGGHVAIPRGTFGLGAGSPEEQMVSWLARHTD